MNETPLTKADLSNAKNGCYECEILRREVERMKAVGLDTTEAELRLEHLDRFYKAVIQEYGPLVMPGR
jgi:phage terminase small subunit